MSGLAEDTLTAPTARRRWTQAAAALGAVALIAGAVWWLQGLSSGTSTPQRQVARISILPDTPPPPPPPPKEERPPPRDEAKPLARDDTPKPTEAPKPANEPLKMEGQAGEGPSAFAAGAVRNEYSGGAPSTGASASGTASDRARDRFYANTARQMLRDTIERHLKSDSEQATAEFTLWLEPDGAIRRFELVATGDTRLDGELDAALGETRRSLRLPPPPTALQPMRFRLTLRPQG